MTVVDDACFYVLDSRPASAHENDIALWWKPNSSGYTTEIDKAGLYTAEQCASMRITDVPIHRDLVRSLIKQHVRLDDLRQSGALDMHKSNT